MKELPISILLPTYNCQATVRDTLESVKWADDILVVDSFSTDATIEICKEYNVRIVQHDYVNPARQKNWAIPLCRHDWIFQIDADEVMEEGLYQEIREAISSAGPKTRAFRIPRKNHILGRWMRFGGIYPDYQARVFMKEWAQFNDREVHETLLVNGSTGTLERHIVHYGMESISKQLGNMDRYTRYEADEWLKRGERYNGYMLILYPLYSFLSRYFLRQGFREGWRGFILCMHMSIYAFYAHSKRWEVREMRLSRSPKL